MRSLYRFSALLLAVFLIGCGKAPPPPEPAPPPPAPAPAPPPPPPPPQAASHHIMLDVKSGPANGEPGYIDTTGSNGQTYHYRYSGGVNDTGNVVVHSTEGPNVPVAITLKGSYAIGEIKFINDQHSQLTPQPGANPKAAVIMDKNDAKQAAYYMVIVNDDSVTPAATIPCDPGIVNN